MTIKRDVREFTRTLNQAINKATDKRSLIKIGNQAIVMIKDRTRQGFGVKKSGGVRRKLTRLSPNYIEQRKRMRLSPFTRANKSNLTRSGRMLASLRVTTRDNRVVVKPTGTSREGESNVKIAEYVADQGRAFLNLSAIEIKKLLATFRKELDRVLK